MIKYVTAIILALLVAETVCETSCSLGDLNLIEDVTKMNGTWSDYQKTSAFLTDITCFTYDFNCPNDTTCEVDLIQKDAKKGSNVLAKNEDGIKWGTDQVYINVDAENKYAILWNCEEKDAKTQYQLAVLMKDVKDEAVTKKIEDIFADIKVTYKSEPTIIDYKACNDATTLTISIVMALIITFNLLL